MVSVAGVHSLVLVTLSAVGSIIAYIATNEHMNIAIIVSLGGFASLLTAFFSFGALYRITIGKWRRRQDRRKEEGNEQDRQKESGTEPEKIV